MRFIQQRTLKGIISGWVGVYCLKCVELKRAEEGIMSKASLHIKEGTLEPGNEQELLL